MRRLAPVVLVAAASACLPATALAYENGHLPRSALSRVHIPKDNTAYLAKDAAAHWNTMRLCALADGQDLYPEHSPYHPAATAYRSYRIQVIFWRKWGSPRAAYPGTSNHGWGRAVDLEHHSMRAWIDEHGERFGWGKHGDAPQEWDHITFEGGGEVGPDPGTSGDHPILRRGSGGICQARFVRRVQRALDLESTSEFDRDTERAVERFQRAHGLPVGPVRRATWAMLDEARDRRDQPVTPA
jgi:murein L,D-transpeptidase YcbB/YkuD